MQHPFAHRISLYVLGAALALTLAFHFTIGMHFHGFAIAVFFLLLTIAVHVLFAVANLQPNRWAYVFLAPMVCGLFATMLYASDQAQFLGFALAAISFLLFAFWSANPLSRWDLVTQFFPGKFWRESFFPFGVSESPTRDIAVGNHWKPIILGAIISVPILFLFAGLFVSADQFFAQSLRGLTDSITDIITIPKLMWDMILFVMISNAAWLMWTRVRDVRSPIQKERLFRIDTTMIATVLAIVNVLFLVFVVFQGIYFFAGHDYVQAHDLVYADYMRQGFDQLLIAAGFVFGGTLLVHRLTRMTPKSIRVLSLALIAETFVILASAAKRLWLYVDAYHLTIDRYWGFVILGFIGLMLAWYFVNLLRRTTFSTQLKHTVVGGLYFFGLALLLNQNVIIANWNLAHREGVIELDTNYMLYDLMPDAAQVVKTSLFEEPRLWIISGPGYKECADSECYLFQDRVRQRLKYLQSKAGSPLFSTVSEQKALQIWKQLAPSPEPLK